MLPAYRLFSGISSVSCYEDMNALDGCTLNKVYTQQHLSPWSGLLSLLACDEERLVPASDMSHLLDIHFI